MQTFETATTKVTIGENNGKVVIIAADKECGGAIVIEDFAQVFYLDSYGEAVEFAKDLLKK